MTKMKLVDFNLLMTLIAMTKGKVKNNGYIGIDTKNVLPEYPRDLSKFAKPSIIIQKVADDISDTCFDRGFIGQTYDDIDEAMVDVHSKMHEIVYQFDVFGDTNTECSFLTSLITDIVLEDRQIGILDFVTDIKNPQLMGVAKLHSDIDVVQLDATENYNYRSAIRVYLTVIQTIIPKQEFVDLRKWMKISQKIILGGNNNG